MTHHTDVGRLRDALEALAALNVLGERGQSPSNAARLRQQLDRILETFEISDEVARIAKRLSGAAWVAEFPDNASTSDLLASFKSGAESFIAALSAAGAKVRVSSTLRPKERAHLMHYSWRVAKQLVAAKDVPAKAGVDIEWVHASDDESRKGAQEMVDGYGMKKEAALNGRHTEGRAIDMTISWTGNLTIQNADGTSTTISSSPKTGENTDLHKVGKTYGVVKATFAGDPPHWSDDGL